MARTRSARKHDVPFRTPSRNTSAGPVSLRICFASASIRRAIFLALYVLLIFLVRILQDHLEAHLESLRNLEAADPNDLIVPDQQRNAVADFGGDFTINQKILQLFVAEAITGAAVAEGEMLSAQC